MAKVETVPQEFDEIIAHAKARGADPEKHVTCVPGAGSRGARVGIRGCPGENKCPFKFTRNGGFKGLGPKNVIYYLDTREHGPGNKKEDFAPCYRYVHLLIERQRTGRRDIEAGKPGEIIAIVGHEDHPDPQKRIVHQRWRGPVNEADKRLEAAYKTFTKQFEVPKYEFTNDIVTDDYEKQIAAAQRKREEEDPGMAIGIPDAPGAIESEGEEEEEDWTSSLDDGDEEKEKGEAK